MPPDTLQNILQTEAARKNAIKDTDNFITVEGGD
jgi:hypothetical protein